MVALARAIGPLSFFGAAVLLACGGAEFVIGGSGPPGDDAGPGAIDAQAPPDGSTGGTPDASPPALDGAKHPKDGGGGGGDDASLPNDSGPPGTDATDAPIAVTFSCATTSGPAVLFCSDFDESTKSPWGWSLPGVFGGGANALDTATYLSPPAAFAATTPGVDAGGAAGASLSEGVSTSAGSLSYAFQIRVKELDTSGASVPFASLTIGPNTANYESFTLAFGGTGLELTQVTPSADGGQRTQTTPIVGSIGPNVWVHVDMTLNRNIPAWTMTVALDGATGLVAQSIATPSDTSVQIGLGILDVTPPTGADALDFDNVVLRGLP